MDFRSIKPVYLKYTRPLVKLLTIREAFYLRLTNSDLKISITGQTPFDVKVFDLNGTENLLFRDLQCTTYQRIGTVYNEVVLAIYGRGQVLLQIEDPERPYPELVWSCQALFLIIFLSSFIGAGISMFSCPV